MNLLNGFFEISTHFYLFVFVQSRNQILSGIIEPSCIYARFNVPYNANSKSTESLRCAQIQKYYFFKETFSFIRLVTWYPLINYWRSNCIMWAFLSNNSTSQIITCVCNCIVFVRAKKRLLKCFNLHFYKAL